MIGTQPEGAIPGVVMMAQAHKGLSVTVDGKPARLAVVTDDGQVVAVGADVATEAENVVLNCYRNFWRGQGHLKVMSNAIKVN